MRRSLLVLAAIGLLGFVLPGQAEACHKRRCHQTCYEPPPPPPPPPCYEPCKPKKHCHLFKKRCGGCAPAPACETVVYEAAPVHYVTYAAPAPVYYAAPQASPQGGVMAPAPQAPAKAMPQAAPKGMPAPPAAQTPAT